MGTRRVTAYDPPLPWLRLYVEFATDPKVQMLPEAMQRRYVMLLCLTGSRLVPTADDAALAFALRLSTEDTAETKRVLMDARLVGRTWKPLAWDRRQRRGDHTAADRQRRKRGHEAARKKDKGEGNTGADHATVTDKSRDASRDGHAAEGEERKNRSENNRSEEDALGRAPVPPASEAPPLNGGIRKVRDLVQSLKSPSPKRASRRNGSFEGINDAILKLIREGGQSADDALGIARMLQISELQARTSLAQLRDRGELPRVEALQ